MSDPSRLVNALTAYWQSAMLVAAIDLGVFDAVAHGARTRGALARACRADAGAIGRLCDALVADGWLRRVGGKYRLTAASAPLGDRDGASHLAGLRHFYNAPPLSTGFASLATTVRRGNARQSAVNWARFADTLLPLRRTVAAPLAELLHTRGLGRGRILDVGAGASPLGIALLRRQRTATLTALDDAAVLRVARRHARAAGVSSRLTTVAGHALSVAWPQSDLVVMMNVLDYFTAADQVALLRKARQALSSGGVLAIVAPLLNEQRRSPEHAVAYDLMLLAIGGGAASTVSELRMRLRTAGFRRATWLGDADVMLAFA